MKMGEVQTFIRILCKCCFLTTLGSGYCYWGALREKILLLFPFTLGIFFAAGMQHVLNLFLHWRRELTIPFLLFS